MADQKVTRAQMLSLLSKLATDDTYRAQFAANPAQMLEKEGVPAAQVKALVEEYMRPGKLADKNLFHETHQRLNTQQSQDCMCMVVPNFRLDYGNK